MQMIFQGRKKKGGPKFAKFQRRIKSKSPDFNDKFQ
jgi:hypothetical protein